MASSAFKSCPTCQKRWAATFKFCPEDGSSLVDEANEAPASPSQKQKGGSRRSSRILDLPPVTATLTNPSTPAAPTTRQAPPEPARPARPPVKGGAAGKVPASNKTTVADVPAAPSSVAPRASRTAPTLLVTPAITEELAQQALGRGRQADPQKTRPELAAAKASAAPPAAAAEAQAQPPSEGKRKRGGFSETEWFLAPINPDEVDVKTGKVKVDPSKYERNPATPEEKRRRFSLKRDDEE